MVVRNTYSTLLLCLDVRCQASPFPSVATGSETVVEGGELLTAASRATRRWYSGRARPSAVQLSLLRDVSGRHVRLT